MEKKSKKKTLIICLIVVVVLAIVGIIGYVAYEKYQDKLLKEKQELIANSLEKCNIIETQMALLILSEEEQQGINVELENIKKAINEENITENTTVSINNLNNKIEKIKANNNTFLTDKENELNGINVEKFNEEQNNKSAELQNQYQELKSQGKYKEAQAKIQEGIDYKNNTNAEITKAEEEAEAERIRQEEEKKKQQTSQKKPTQSTQQTTTQTTTQTTPQQSTPQQSQVQEQPTTTQPDKMYGSEAIDISYSGSYNAETGVYTITGTITNKTNYSFSKVVSSFRVENFTGSGIGSAQATVMAVKPNSTRSFTCTTRTFTGYYDPENCTNTAIVAYK